MNKYASIFCALILSILYPIFVSAQTTDNEDVAALKAKIVALQAQVSDLQSKLVAQVNDDMAMLAKLRKENRELKVALREIRLSSGVKTISSGSTSRASVASQKTASASSQKAQVADATNAAVTQNSAKKSEKVVKKEVLQAEESNLEDEPKKDPRNTRKSGIWDNMFPF